MAVYYYLSGKTAEATQKAVLAYTHNDVFKPVPGFKVLSGHFHLDFNETLTDHGSLDYQPTWVPVFRGLGLSYACTDRHRPIGPQVAQAATYAEEACCPFALLLSREDIQW